MVIRRRTAATVRSPIRPVVWKDSGARRRGQFRPRPDRPPGDGRSDPDDAAAPGHWLETRQALDHQPRSGVCAKQRRRDRLIAHTQAHPEWALGFADEVWMRCGGAAWRSRACMPGPKRSSPCAWSNRRSPKPIPIPKRWPATASCCAASDTRKRSGCALSRGAPQCDHHPVPGLVLPQAGGAGRSRVGADLGQRLLARQ